MHQVSLMLSDDSKISKFATNVILLIVGTESVRDLSFLLSERVGLIPTIRELLTRPNTDRTQWGNYYNIISNSTQEKNEYNLNKILEVDKKDSLSLFDIVVKQYLSGEIHNTDTKISKKVSQCIYVMLDVSFALQPSSPLAKKILYAKNGVSSALLDWVVNPNKYIPPADESATYHSFYELLEKHGTDWCYDLNNMIQGWKTRILTSEKDGGKCFYGHKIYNLLHTQSILIQSNTIISTTNNNNQKSSTMQD